MWKETYDTCETKRIVEHCREKESYFVLTDQLTSKSLLERDAYNKDISKEIKALGLWHKWQSPCLANARPWVQSQVTWHKGE
jgi:hypothetical protein